MQGLLIPVLTGIAATNVDFDGRLNIVKSNSLGGWEKIDIADSGCLISVALSPEVELAT